MTAFQDQSYLDGYLAGYRDGLKEASSGNSLPELQGDVLSLPIRNMNLSTRALICLFRAGCSSIGDAACLSLYSIRNMRNLEPKTAAEISLRLHELGIRSTAWQCCL